MKSVCTICSRADRAVIDAAFISDAKIISMALSFGVSRFALMRHRKHIIELRGRPKDPKKARDDASLLAEILELQAKTTALIAKAERAGDLKTMLAAIEMQRDLIELKANPSRLVKPQKSGKVGKGEKPATEGFKHGEQLEHLVERSRLFDIKTRGSNATLPASA